MCNLISNVIDNLIDKIPAEYIETVKQELIIATRNYDIKPLSTELSLQNGIPSWYKSYMVSGALSGSKATMQTYAVTLEDFFSKCNKSVDKVQADDIRAYLYVIKKATDITDTTLNNKLSAIKSFFSWSVENGYLSENPTALVKPKKCNSQKRTPVSDDELTAMRNACTKKRDRAILEFFYATGCRLSEFLNCKISDVDFTNKTVSVLGKGNKFRKVPLSNEAILYLVKYLGTRTDKCEYLFITERTQKQMSPDAVEKVISTIAKSAGIERKIYPHLLRHALATDLLESGMEVSEIQHILGHSNISTTMIYADVNSLKVKNDYDRIMT